MKVLHSVCQQIWKTQQWRQDWKKSVFITIPKRGNAKECSSDHTIVLISHASKVMHKILQARLQQCVNRELPVAQADFRKGRGIRIRFPTSTDSSQNQKTSRKMSTSALLTMPKCLAVWITTDWKIQQWPQDWKRSVPIPIPKKGDAKECLNYRTIALISHAQNSPS